MKIYQVIIRHGDDVQTTYCDYCPKTGEMFTVNGKRWVVVGWM